MFVARLPAAIAGPSRLALPSRSFHRTALAARPALSSRASRGPSITIPWSHLHHQSWKGANVAGVGLRMQSTSMSAQPRWQKTKMSERVWPWHPVDNPPKGTEEVERVIHSRRDGFDPKLTWAFLVLALCGLVTTIVLPSPAEAVAAGIREQDADEPVALGLPQSVWYTYIMSGSACVIAFGILASMLYQSRTITRLSLVRQKPVGAPASEAREFIRLRHGAHDLFPGMRLRELEAKQVHPYLIMGRETKSGERYRSPWVKVVIDSPRPKYAPVLSVDHVPYRLDFRETPALERFKGELVLSTARLEDVFGQLKPQWGAVSKPATK